MKNDFAVVRALSGQSNILVIPKIYLALTNDLKAALVLSQCIFWSDKGGRPDGYIYKTHQEWETETSLTRREFDTARKLLQDLGLVEFEVKRANGHGTLHFRVVVDKLMMELRNIELLSNGSEKDLSSLAESANLGDIQDVQCDKSANLSLAESANLSLAESANLLTVNNTFKTAVNNTTIDEFFASFETPVLAAINHPMIQLWQGITGNGSVPGSKTWTPIIECMEYFVKIKGGEAGAREYLRPYWLRWKNGKRKSDGRPFDKFGLNWLTEWAMQGDDPNSIPNGTKNRDGGLDAIHFDNL
jgi:hypothetical protein